LYVGFFYTKVTNALFNKSEVSLLRSQDRAIVTQSQPVSLQSSSQVSQMAYSQIAGC